ncbi:MAG: aminotransferase class I/II-fold pyridoxal phosphate-dependent enzyme [Desulfitobacteriaceae bacterium]
MNFNTALLHGNFTADKKSGATTIPIYQSSAFRHETAEELENIFRGSEPGFIYTRLNNPTIESFERRMAYLEKGVGGVACASGMAAVTLAVLNILQSGDEILCGSGLFGGTYSLFEGFKTFGITTKYVDNNEISHYEAAITERTRIIFVETIGNPKLDVADIRGLAELAHANGIPLFVDNTVTSPYLVRPLELGADIVIHSTSKYINGSGNSIGGIILDSGKFKWDSEKYPGLKEFKKFGKFTYLAKLRKSIFKDFGACISPFNVYLTSLGLETLGIRMERLCSNALALANSLTENSKVSFVNYPGLEDNHYYELAKAQFSGKYGGILTIRVGSKENAFRVINNLKYASNLANVGDVRTLVIHPASTIYETNSLGERKKMGVYEDLIRISVGLEDLEDIVGDFQQALASL